MPSFTADAVIKRNQTSSFTVNAVIKRTMVSPHPLVYPGYNSGLYNGLGDANTLTGPIPITPGTQITIQVYAQSGNNLGIQAGPVPDFSKVVQNTWDNSPVGAHTFTVNSPYKYVWVYAWPWNPGLTGSGTYSTDKSLGEWLWLDAVKTQTQTGSRTINAVIAPLRFTANAVKTATPTGSRPVDAVIAPLRFRVNALIVGTRTGSRTINAIIRQRNIPGSFTVNAQLERTFKVNAVLRTTRTPTFAADAYVIRAPMLGSFTADAIRLKTIIGVGSPVPIFLHTFSTPTSAPPFNAGTPDLGNTLVWTDWDSWFNSAALSTTHVDAGGYLTVEANKYDSFRGPPSITTGEVSLDFWVPASGDTQQQFYWNDAQWWAGYQDSGANYQVFGSSSSGLWPVTRSAWHRFHVIVDGATVRSHIWKVGDAEPSTWTTVQTTWPVVFNSNPTYVAQAPIVDMYYAPSSEALRIDNITVSGPSVGITASANIVGTRTGSFAANAVIRKPGQTGTFTVDATFGQGLFRINAVIAAGQTGSFSTNAAVRKIISGSFTANAYLAFIVTSSFTADANILATQAGSFPINYMTRQTPTSLPIPSSGVPTKIYINGVDVSGHVKWATASFTAKVNGQMGDCQLEVIDKAHDLTFTFGDEIQLYVDGIIRWGGWVQQVNRTFPFPVMKSPATEARLWKITGVDYNFFLDRRILHDSAHPNKTWNYPAGTADNVIFNNIWPYFDTTGFTKNIHHVGDGVLDIPGVTSKTGGNVAQGGFSMRDVLLHLTWDTGAIFYVTPTKVVTYVDADQVSSPYTLTDQPSGVMDVGFHDVRISEDSTEMVNDAHVWGAGKGSANVVHAQAQSIPSQDDHGRWQAGNFTAGIYKQATANAVALARVEGSPESKRGAKNPKRAVELLTWEPVFGVGDVVNFHDSQFFLPPSDPEAAPTHDDVLPIRTMTITWPTPYHPLFALQLSWEIDAVWSFFDPWLPVGPAGTGGGPGGGGPTTTTQDGGGGGCDAEVCGITDAYQRVTSGLGVSDAGITYTYSGNSFGSWAVDGTRAIHEYAPFSASFLQWTAEAALSLPRQPNSFRVDFELSAMPDHLHGYHFLRINSEDAGGGGDITLNDSTNNVGIYVVGGAGGATFVPAGFSFIGQRVSLRAEFTAAAIRVRVWPYGDPEPSSWTHTRTAFGPPPAEIEFAHWQILNDASTTSYRTALYLYELDIDGVDRCGAVQYDDFNRSVTSSLGSNLSDSPYINQFVSGTWGVDGSSAYVGSTGASGVIGQWNYDNVPFDNKDFVMTSRIKLDTLPNNVSGASVWHYRTEDSVTGDYVWAEVTVAYGVPAHIRLSYSVGPNTDGIQDDIPFTAGTWYLIKWDTQNGMKIWAEGTSEPSTWHVLVQPVHHRDRLYLTMQSRFKASIDYIDFSYADRPCYPCEAGWNSFDNFNRSVSGGWGTAAPYGSPWTIISNSPPAVGVSDGAGYLTYSASPSNTGAGILMKILPGPWGNTGITDCVIAFRTSGVETTEASTLLIQWVASNGSSGGQAIFYISTTVGSVGQGGGGSVAKNDWVANTTYLARFRRDTSITGNPTHVRVWVKGTPEPTTWDATGASLAGVLDPGAYFLLSWNRGVAGGLHDGGPARTLYVESIDFEYEGRLCSSDCGPTDGSLEVFDNFSRSVPGPTLNWGTASSGASWLIQSPTNTTGRVAYVDGSRGVITATSTGSQSRSVNPIISSFPTPITWPFVMAYDVDISDIVGDSVSAYGLSFAGRTGPGSLDYAWFECLLYTGGTTPQRMFDTSISGSGASVQYGPPITSGTLMVVADFTTCTVYHNGSQIYQDVWRDFDLNPMVVPDGTDIDQMDMAVSAGYSGGPTNLTITSSISNISFKDRGNWGTFCTDTEPSSPGAGGSNVPSGTNLTEDLTPLSTPSGAPPTFPANSHWQTTNSILPGSAVLRVDGVVRYGNWSIYDAHAGVIQYDPTLVATSTVSITYITNGPLS